MKRGAPLAVAGAGLLLLSGCTANWGWYVVDPTTASGAANLRFLLSGLYYTVLLSVTAILISVALGLLIALPGLGTNRLVRGFNRVYVEVVRAVPILVLILWVYYGMPQIADVAINVFWAGVIALALSDSAFQAEIFRAGIQSIGRGQYEAAQSISLGYVDTMRFVILPQAIRRILPALGNQFVYMLKMSSLVSVIRDAGADPEGERAGGDRVSPARDLYDPRPRVPGADPARVRRGAMAGTAHGDRCAALTSRAGRSRKTGAGREEEEHGWRRPGSGCCRTKRRTRTCAKRWHSPAPLTVRWTTSCGPTPCARAPCAGTCSCTGRRCTTTRTRSPHGSRNASPRTSRSLNDCPYSLANHWANARHLIGDDARAARIEATLASRRPEDVFEGRELALMRYAEKLTLRPGAMERADAEALSAAGLDDGEILEANQIVGYFNYVNRCLNGLGVTTDGDVVGYYADP